MGRGLAGRGGRLGRQSDQHESAPRDQHRLMLEPPFFYIHGVLYYIIFLVELT